MELRDAEGEWKKETEMQKSVNVSVCRGINKGANKAQHVKKKRKKQVGLGRTSHMGSLQSRIAWHCWRVHWYLCEGWQEFATNLHCTFIQLVEPGWDQGAMEDSG